MKKLILFSSLCLLAFLSPVFFPGGLSLSAQQFGVSTNIMDYANYGTLNAEASVSLERNWSLSAQAKYNPFRYSRDGEPLSARQQTYALGTRYWPWHVYSGWWLGAKMQYQEYNRGGIKSPSTREGDRYGAGLSAGYSYMLLPHLNMDFGIGAWTGYDRYVIYSCPVCGLTQEKGGTWFVLPHEILLSLLYVF